MILSKMTGISATEMKDMNFDYSDPNAIVFIRGSLLIQFLGFFLIPSLLFAYFADPYPKQYLGLKKPWSHWYWILGIVVMLAAIPFSEAMGRLNEKLSFGADVKELEEQLERQTKFILDRHTIGDLIANLFFIALLAGVGEELLFRGVIQRMLIRAFKSPWAGIIISAAIFSAIHMQFSGFFPRLLLGVLLGAIYWYSGSLWTAILAHFAYDSFLVLLVYFNPEFLEKSKSITIGPENLIINGVVSLGIVTILILRMKKLSKTSYEETYRDDHPPIEQY